MVKPWQPKGDQLNFFEITEEEIKNREEFHRMRKRAPKYMILPKDTHYELIRVYLI